MSKTPEEIANALDAFTDVHNSNRASLLDTIEAEMRSCIDAPASTDRQMELARQVICQMDYVRKAEDVTQEAIHLGMAYEAVRAETMQEPASKALLTGDYWFGRFVSPLGDKERAFLNHVRPQLRLNESGKYAAVIDMYELVPAVWDKELFNIENHGRYRKLVSTVGTKMLDTVPKINTQFSIEHYTTLNVEYTP